MNDKKRVLFICFTKSHYLMAEELIKEFKLTGHKIESFIYCSGFLYHGKENILAQKIFDNYYFFNEHSLITNLLRFIELRSLIKRVKNHTIELSPDIILTFSDNSILYQSIFASLKKKVKIILFHEGYGDYSEINISTKAYIYFLLQKILIYPYPFKIITRSYTDYYKYSFLLFPKFVERTHKFKKFLIPKQFMQNVYLQNFENKSIEKKSIFLCLSGKDWLNGNLNQYFIQLLEKLNTLNNKKTYIKIAPHQSISDYQKVLDIYSNILLIDDASRTSEAYCTHENFDYIVTDESSSVVSAIFLGIEKTIFFLNSDIEVNGFYIYDKNDLVSYFVKQNIVKQNSLDETISKIRQGYCNSSAIHKAAAKSIGEQLEEIIND